LLFQIWVQLVPCYASELFATADGDVVVSLLAHKIFRAAAEEGLGEVGLCAS
jgi:hypothetical protein